MKNIIIGTGKIGLVTGEYLEVNGEEVIYIDTPENLEKIEKEGKTTEDFLPNEYDVCWICTEEDVVLQSLPLPILPQNDDLNDFCGNTITIIRSNVSPKIVDSIIYENVIHFPVIDDIIDPQQIIIGTKENINKNIVEFFEDYYLRFFEYDFLNYTTMKMSSIVPLIRDAWFATVRTFWNEMFYNLPNDGKKQMLANMISQSDNISRSGTLMLGRPYKYNIDSLIEYTDSNLLKMIKELNGDNGE